jgi:hypothetical protein
MRTKQVVVEALQSFDAESSAREVRWSRKKRGLERKICNIHRSPWLPCANAHIRLGSQADASGES